MKMNSDKYRPKLCNREIDQRQLPVAKSFEDQRTTAEITVLLTGAYRTRSVPLETVICQEARATRLI